MIILFAFLLLSLLAVPFFLLSKKKELYSEKQEKSPESLWNLLNAQLVALNEQGKFTEALKIAQDAQNLAAKIFGENNDKYAVALNNLAAIYKREGRYDEAESHFKQAMEIWQKTLGEEHSNIAYSLNNLAEIYLSKSKLISLKFASIEVNPP